MARGMERGLTRLALLRTAGAAAVSVITATAACMPGGPDGGAAQPAAKTKLGGKVYMQSRGGEPVLDVFKQQVRAFNEEVPGVQVEVDSPTGSYFEKFQTLVAAGSPLDVAFMSDREPGSMVRAGTIQPLDPFLAKDRDFKETDFRKSAWYSMTYQGKRWGLPWDAGVLCIYFGFESLQAAGLPLPDPKKRLSGDEFLPIARRLTVDTSGRRATEAGFDPASVRTYGLEANNFLSLPNYVFSAGGELLTTDGQVPIDSPAAIAGLQFWADLRAKWFVQRGPKYPTSLPATLNAFISSPPAAAMWDVGPAAIGRVNAAKQRYGVMAHPVQKLPVSQSAYSPLVLTKQAQNVDAVWAWMYFACLSEHGQAMLVDVGQVQPTRRSLEARFVNVGAPPAPMYRQVFVDALDDKVQRVVGDKAGTYWGGYRGEWGQLWEAMLVPVYKAEKQVAQIASDLRRHTETLLKTGQLPVLN